jgi:hypothetical protein
MIGRRDSSAGLGYSHWLLGRLPNRLGSATLIGSWDRSADNELDGLMGLLG